MATNPVVIGARAANTEARNRYVGEMEHREQASGILKPGEVSGDYNSARLLQTTLGGQLRALTHDDLRAFRDTVKKLGKKFKGGITAKAVIDMSTQGDRDRANKEIHQAVPMQSMGGRVHFVTNSGPNSEVTRHHVHIEMLNYSAAVSSPVKMSEVAKMLTTGPLKFDCDCGQHQYRYRYIATTGNFNAGRSEPGFPKLTNPRLIGVACKHVLRVMQQLNMPLIRAQVEKMIERGRTSLDRKPQALTKKEAEDLVKQQAAQSHWKRNQVETAGEKRTRLVLANKTKITLSKALSKAKARSKDAALRELQSQLQVYRTKNYLSAAQVASILASIKK
jgi:hypothetical protein